MKRVPAYWGRFGVVTRKCPIGRYKCAVGTGEVCEHAIGFNGYPSLEDRMKWEKLRVACSVELLSGRALSNQEFNLAILKERFFSKTKRASEPRTGMATPCLEWQAAKSNGYGRIGTDSKKTETASRLAWKLKHGDVPRELHVCHHCDNPSCVDVEHMFLGTDADNSADMVSKNRQCKGERKSAIMKRVACRGERMREIARANAIRGERNKWAKLTEDDVRTVFKLRANGLLMKDIGSSLGVKINCISRILSRKRWGHVQISETAK